MTEFYVICFDVHDAKRLRKIANEMENFGTRVQRSVFECHLNNEQLQELKPRLAQLMAIEADQVRYYPLCGKDQAICIIDGTGKLTTDPDYLIV
jgi:CRISPR-associated protein Cas2